MLNFYEIKKGRNWEMVKSSGMATVSTYCKNNNYSDFRTVGMMSRSETIEANENCREV